MRFLPVPRAGLAVGTGCLLLLTRLPGSAAVDPAVVGERLQRLDAAVESLELGQASQRRQIEELSRSLQRFREELFNQGGQRPWSGELKSQNEDLKRLAAAIEEVDRKRIADHQQVLEILGGLRKAVSAAAADTPGSRSPSRTPAPGPAPDKDPKPDTYVEHTLSAGESLSLILRGFNEEARKNGYQTLSVEQVMTYNRIKDDRRIPEGAVIKLPLLRSKP